MRGYHRRLALLMWGATCLGCADATSSDAWEPLTASDQYGGKTREEWAAEWGRWAYAQTTCDFVDRDADGSHCGDFQPQGSQAFFLAAGVPGVERTRCVVPAGKALVFPLAARMADNAGVPAADQLSEDDLRAYLEQAHASMTDLLLVVDGKPVEDLASYAVRPTRFSYELPPEPNWYSCSKMPGVTGTVDPAFITGYFVVLPPPDPGAHTLEYGGVTRIGGTSDSSHVSTTFNVRTD